MPRETNRREAWSIGEGEHLEIAREIDGADRFATKFDATKMVKASLTQNLLTDRVSVSSAATEQAAPNGSTCSVEVG